MDGGDHSTIECSICCEALSPPISKCTEGHAICSSCQLKLPQDCVIGSLELPQDCVICSLQTIYTCAITLEKVADSAAFPCRNTKYGCRQFLSFSQMRLHESTCDYARFFCPKKGCSFEGSKHKLMLHLAEHYSVLICVFGHDEEISIELCSSRNIMCLLSEDNFLYLIIRKDTALGWAVSVVCIRPPEVSKPELRYELSLKCDREFHLRLETRIESTTLLNGLPEDKRFLLIPAEFCASGCVKLNVCIRKNPV
ncbi:hypothetical protein LUZ61_012001 [Rhynchospora tenuis]|uniref:RING-type E3 ubiquitin transferase n=1 Tax=Rhynchospora tenuis TaxID=198213 RepID=A0AAD6F0S4_9POAL|nr:hypothetical protein LUZ61_012001 [Rhynchospora tenuis]